MKRNPKVVSFERSPAYVHHRAMVNRRENNDVDALELMRRAVEDSPENREYRLDLAELYCEMGCHAQSNRLLLDMLAQKDAPAECYYGLALNQLGMNDIEGARQSLRLYRHAAPDGAHAEEVRRLSVELYAYDAMNRPMDRKLGRAVRAADRACEALRDGDRARARRLFERSLALSSEQYEMRALYALTLMLDGEGETALAEAARAAQGYPPSARALCVAAQVFIALGRGEDARRMLRRAMSLRPEGTELHLLLYALSEAGMDAEVAELARLALQSAPFERRLLHIRATALHRTGTPDDQVERFWRRILRIAPDDEVARFYQQACACGQLKQNEPDYAYQLPRQEHERRFERLASLFGGGIDLIASAWQADPAFRRAVRWAAENDDRSLSRLALFIIAAMDGCEFNGYPDKLYDTCEASVSETYTSFADSYGMSVEELYDAYGMTQEDVDAEIMDTVNRRLFISAICQAEDITVTSDEYTAFLESLYPDYGYDDAESFETDYGKDYLMWYLYENKVADYLVNNASLYEAPVSMDAEDLEVYDEDTESETEGDTLEGLDDADAEEEYVTETVTEEDDLTEEETEAES